MVKDGCEYFFANLEFYILSDSVFEVFFMVIDHSFQCPVLFYFIFNGKSSTFVIGMEKKNDILSKLRKTLDEQGVDSFHVLEDLVPIEEQMQYFKYFEKIRGEKKPFVRDEEVAILFSPDVPIDRKKKSLSLLASIPDVGAYRAIETYHSNPPDVELLNWSSMALVSSRIILSSDLSGQQQIYVSSGLGGLEKKLRFFALFASKERQIFTEFQREVVEREFRFQLQQVDVDIEKFEIRKNYFTILMLQPFDVDVQSNIDAAVNECNEYGNFLDKEYLFTNIKTLSEQEIQALLERKKEE